MAKYGRFDGYRSASTRLDATPRVRCERGLSHESANVHGWHGGWWWPIVCTCLYIAGWDRFYCWGQQQMERLVGRRNTRSRAHHTRDRHLHRRSGRPLSLSGPPNSSTSYWWILRLNILLFIKAPNMGFDSDLESQADVAFWQTKATTLYPQLLKQWAYTEIWKVTGFCDPVLSSAPCR